LNLDSQDFWIGWILIKIIREVFFQQLDASGKRSKKTRHSIMMTLLGYIFLQLQDIAGAKRIKHVSNSNQIIS